MHLTFESLGTEANFDFVDVFDGSSPRGESLSHASGDLSSLGRDTSMSTSGNAAYVQFTTDGSVQDGPGFDISYDCANDGGGDRPAACTPIRVDSRPMTGNIEDGQPVSFCLTASATACKRLLSLGLCSSHRWRCCVPGAGWADVRH